MTLLETTYNYLNDYELTQSARHFSKTYLKRNANYYAYQTHKNRDFCLSAAVDFVKSVNAIMEDDTLDKERRTALLKSKHHITQYLQNTHSLHII